MAHHVIDIGSFDVLSRVLPHRQFRKVFFATFYFGILYMPRVIPPVAAFGFYNKVELSPAIYFNQHGPVGFGAPLRSSSTIVANASCRFWNGSLAS